MSIKLNEELIAGKYKEQVIPNADTINKGIAKIATQEEISNGTDNTTIVTPLYLSRKQDKLVAGEGIDITDNTITSSVKADKRTLDYTIDNNLEVVGSKSKNNVYKYDWIGTKEEYRLGIENQTIDPEWYCYITDDERDVNFNRYTNIDLDNLTEAGKQVIIDTAGGGSGGTGNPDNITIDINKNDQLQAIGVFEKNKKNAKYDWVGTLEEYIAQDIENLHPEWICYITDDYTSMVKDDAQLNNPYSLLDCKWSDHKLSNISWLLSEGQWNSGTTYKSVYDLLLKEYNSGEDITETLFGIPITYRKGKDTNLRIITDKTAYDSLLAKAGTAWFYVLDTSNIQFCLPQTNGMLQFGGEGEFVEAGLPNIEGEAGKSISALVSGAFYKGKSASSSGTTSGDGNVIILDASRSNPIYGKSETVQPNAVKGYLYFYVGETVENANLINAGRIEEQFVDIKTNKANTDLSNLTPEAQSKLGIAIKEAYVNGLSGYNIYSNGFCEQWGRINSRGNDRGVAFLKSYKNTNYSISTQHGNAGANGSYQNSHKITSVRTNGMTIRTGYSEQGDIYWRVCGYLAEGEY